ncbi:MAG: hypothetical protein HOO88_01060 [Kiritimatiellaceae bacterium]|nr:hypothetical protein [Kiritimatiellaceae bacterium]
MTENLQQNSDQKGPFSPLQTGCAVVMLTNMLIYLGVVAFTFNLLDPSKIDASYLAKRGFTSKPDLERKEDTTFRQIAEGKQAEQKAVQDELLNASKEGSKQEPSPAVRLSQIDQRKFTPSGPEEPQKPKAALTASAHGEGSTIRSAQTRLYSIAIFPQATLGLGYSPYRLATPRIVTLERYDTLPVEMASGISFPSFSLPSADPAGAYLYTPPNPVPEAARGGLKLSSPPVGAESLYTNGIQKAAKPPVAKDRP